MWSNNIGGLLGSNDVTDQTKLSNSLFLCLSRCFWCGQLVVVSNQTPLHLPSPLVLLRWRCSMLSFVMFSSSWVIPLVAGGRLFFRECKQLKLAWCEFNIQDHNCCCWPAVIVSVPPFDLWPLSMFCFYLSCHVLPGNRMRGTLHERDCNINVIDNKRWST